MLAPFERDAGAKPGPDAPEQMPMDPAPEAALELVWRCSVCGYQRLSVERPEQCHGCNAGSAQLIGRTAIEWRFLLRQPAG